MRIIITRTDVPSGCPENILRRYQPATKQRDRTMRRKPGRGFRKDRRTAPNMAISPITTPNHTACGLLPVCRCRQTPTDITTTLYNTVTSCLILMFMFRESIAPPLRCANPPRVGKYESRRLLALSVDTSIEQRKRRIQYRRRRAGNPSSLARAEVD